MDAQKFQTSPTWWTRSPSRQPGQAETEVVRVGVADEAEELGAVDSNVVECVVEKGRRLGHDANRTNSMPTPRCV